MSRLILNDHSTVCRCCLKVLDTTGFTYIDDENGYVDNVGNVREMLQFCVPELDLYVSTHPVICYNCLPILVQIYNFKIKCLNGENLIKSYITRNNLFDYNQVNLNCVLMDDLKMKSQKIQIESRIKHMMLKEIPENNDSNNDSNNEQQVIINDVTQSKSSNNDVNMDTEDDYDDDDDDDDDDDEEENNDKEMKVEFDESEEIDLNYCETNDLEEPENTETIALEEDTNKNNDDMSINNDQALIVAVRKDLFNDKTQQPNIIEEPKEPSRVILNQGMVAQNGRIIIKIDKTKLQSLGIKSLGPQLSESEPNVAPIQVSVPSSSSEPPPVACTPKIIQVQTVKPAEDIPENKPKYNCNKCGFETDDVIKIYDHNRTNHNFDYTCQHCPFSTSKVELLGKHMTMVHPQNMVQRNLHFKVTENYACSMCPFSVKSLDLLRSHHLSAHGNADDNVPIVLNSAFTEDCVRSEPRILKRLEYTCDVCPYTTKDKSNLRKHLFTHGTKPLKCDHCTYKCVSPYQLRRHQKQKHGKQGEQRPRNQPYILPDFKKQNSDEMDNFKITLETIKRELEKEMATS